jgi:hypothetical protein
VRICLNPTARMFLISEDSSLVCLPSFNITRLLHRAQGNGKIAFNGRLSFQR